MKKKNHTHTKNTLFQNGNKLADHGVNLGSAVFFVLFCFFRKGQGKEKEQTQQIISIVSRPVRKKKIQNLTFEQANMRCPPSPRCDAGREGG